MSPRAVCGNFDYLNSSLTKLITDLGWMTIQQRLNYLTCILVYKYLHDLAPNYLSNCFQYVSKSLPYVTHSVTDEPLVVPKPSSSLFKGSLLYNGPLLWNTLPSNVRSTESLNILQQQ